MERDKKKGRGEKGRGERKGRGEETEESLKLNSEECVCHINQRRWQLIK